MILYQLLRPLEYLRIRHPKKACIDWYVPLAVAVIVTVLVRLLPIGLNFYGAEGIVANFLGLFQALPGFFIAALAAVATFGRTDIDEAMPGDPPPLLRIRTNSGVMNMVALSRRRFLCLLFSFLAAECIAMILLSVAYLAVAPALADVMNPVAIVAISFIGALVYFLILSQMLVTTLWGLYYLGDRLHQPDA